MGTGEVTRDDVSRTLRQMENIREQSYEAETEAEERRLDREYGRLSKSIRPYLDGSKPYSEPSVPVDPAAAAARWRP